MRNDTSRMPTLAWAGIVMVLVVVGWVAKATVAQDRRQKPPISVDAAAIEADLDIGASASSISTDPEKAALVFVAENQKLAESQLGNLKDEESKLKARLLKVQAGIKRWESLVEALKQSQESVAVVAPRAPTSRVVSPAELEPVVPGSDPSIVPK
jgi:hypothetical protein